MVDIGIFTMASGERSHEFALSRQLHELFTRKGSRASIHLDIASALESCIELEFYRLSCAFRNERSLPLQNHPTFP